MSAARGAKSVRRIPGWVVPILAGVVGWAVSGWPGALFGVLVGTFVWRMR